jgi:arsenate reductase/ArsR family transcriptional regulator
MANQRNDPERLLNALAGTGKGLAHPVRLRILAMLSAGELCVCQVTAILELAPSTVSRHLSVLSRGGWVAERRDGKLVFYRLREDEVASSLLPPILDLLARDSTARSDGALVARMRRIPIATLCAADLDLVAIGVRRPSDSTAATGSLAS